MASKKHAQCECFDRGCKGNHPAESEHGRCQNTARLVTVYRVDQTDRTGTRMCEGCAGDAMDSGSGLFTTERPR